VVVDGKYVKLRGGRRGVLLIALGLTDHGVRAVLDVALTGEEDVVSYWDLPVRLWRRYNLTLVVADGVKALDTAISSPDPGREADLPGPPQTEGGQEG
jgi:Transposase and inactivated derivatives